MLCSCLYPQDVMVWKKIENEYPNKSWNWYSISRNLGITMKDINGHPDKPWGWDSISMNPNITMKDILNNPDIDNI